MSTGRPDPAAVRQLMKLAGVSAGGQATDRELVERFVQDRSESAFADLMARHGPMVLAVCRRHLRDHHAADDAFQATFIVLARRAGAVKWRESIGGWLFEVASRVAKKSATQAARRAVREGGSADSAPEPAAPTAPAGPDLTALQAALDDELRALPEKLRTPVVLCHLEGLSQEEVARHLGITDGQLRGRLYRAKERLRERLLRRGYTLSAVLLALAVGAKAQAMPAVLAAGTLRLVGSTADAIPIAVHHLALGVIRDMTTTFKTMAFLAVFGVFGIAAAGFAVRSAMADAPQLAQPAPALVAARGDQPAPKAATDKERFQGTWNLKTIDAGDGPKAPGRDEFTLMVFKDDRATIHTVAGDPGEVFALTWDETKKPKTITMTVLDDQGPPERWWTETYIYRFDGAALEIAARVGKGGPPTEFKGVKPPGGVRVLRLTKADEKPAPKLAPVPVRKDDDEKPEEKKLHRTDGTIKSVDAAKNKLVVGLDEEKVEATIDIGAATKLTFGGKPVKLGELKPGMRVAVFDPTEKAAPLVPVEVRAAWPRRGAEVKAIAADGTLTIDSDGFDVVLKVPADAKVIVDGLVAGLSDVPTGRKVDLELGIDKKTVIGIEADGDKGDIPALVKSYDPTANTLLVEFDASVNDRERRVTLCLPVNTNAKVRLAGADAKLSDLKERMPVRLKMTPDRKGIAAVLAAPPLPVEKDDD